MKSRLLRTTSILGLMTGAGLIGLPAGPAHAMVITTDCVSDSFCTPEELQYGGDMQQGGSIQVDDKLFSNWSFGFSGSSVDFLNFTVSGTGEDSNAPGLLFSGDVGRDNGTLTIQYDVTLVDDGRENFDSFRIVDSELELTDYTVVSDDTSDPPGFYGGSIVITESSTAFSAVLEVRVEDLVAPVGPEEETTSDSNDFSPVTSLTVMTTIQLTDNGFLSITDLNAFSQTFSQAQIDVPEPSSAALFGVGLAALGGGMWRRRRRKA